MTNAAPSTSTPPVRPADAHPAFYRIADKAEIRDACDRAVLACREYLDPSRIVDVATSFVAGYAMANLHDQGLTATPAKILEHARTALAEL